MKREGRQHGMVRTFATYSSPYGQRPVPRRALNDGPLTAGLFAKVSSKPTNHSKFTGKFTNHCRPVCKSKDKAKGAHKTRLVGPAGVFGLSATGFLDGLDGEDHDDYYDDDDDDAVGDEFDDDDKFSSRAFEIVGVNGDDNEDKMSWCLVDEKL